MTSRDQAPLAIPPRDERVAAVRALMGRPDPRAGQLAVGIRIER